MTFLNQDISHKNVFYHLKFGMPTDKENMKGTLSEIFYSLFFLRTLEILESEGIMKSRFINISSRLEP